MSQNKKEQTEVCVECENELTKFKVLPGQICEECGTIWYK